MTGRTLPRVLIPVLLNCLASYAADINRVDDDDAIPTPAPTSLLFNPVVMTIQAKNKINLHSAYIYSANFKKSVVAHLCKGCIGIPGVCRSQAPWTKGKVCLMPTEFSGLEQDNMCPKGYQSCSVVKPKGLEYPFKWGNGVGVEQALFGLCNKLSNSVQENTATQGMLFKLTHSLPRARGTYLPQFDTMFKRCTRLFATNLPVPPIKPTHRGGRASKWTAYPKLPPGLYLNQSDGSIAGTPTQPAPPSMYNISATNRVGSVWALLRFGVVAREAACAMSPW
jgi:hypothetical protein